MQFLSQSGEAATLTNELTSIIRQQRHTGTRVVIATQEPTLSPELLDLANVTFVHRFQSPAWYEILKKHLAGADRKDDESAKSLEGGRCDVLTSDKSQLFAQRSKLASPKDYVVLPETISKEPLGPVVRNGDDEWLAIVRWVGYALLNAEEAGITSKNVEAEAKSTKNPDVARMLGADGEYGKDLKLP